jgi:hypothetical protein
MEALKNMPMDALTALVGNRAAGKIREYFLKGLQTK